MARIRPYEQQTSISGVQDIRRASAEDFGFGGAMQEFGKTLQSVGDYIKQEQENRELEDAQVRMAEARQQWTQTYLEREQSMVPGDTTFAPTLKAEMDDYFSTMAQNYTSQKAKKYVSVMGANTTNGFFTQGMQYQVAMAGKKAVADLENRQAADFDTAYKDYRMYPILLNAYNIESQTNTGSFSWLGNDPRKDVVTRQYREKLAWQAGQGWLKNPANRGYLVGTMQGGESVIAKNGTFNAMLPHIFEVEGDEYVEDDAGRGPTKHGVNGEANGLTTEEVANLTKEDAAQIFKKNYWDKYGMDGVPASVVPVVFDGVVNHWPGFAKRLVTAAKEGATSQQLADMRRVEYQRLATDKPEKFGKFLNGWNERVDKALAMSGTVSQQMDSPITVDESKLPEFYQDMNPNDKERFLREALTMHKQERSVASQALKRTIQDHQAEIESTGGILRSPPLQRSAFGDDELLYQQYTAMLKAGEATQNLANASPSQQMEILRKLAPTTSEIPGVFSFQHELYKNAVKNAQAYNKRRAEDPVGFAITSGFSKDNPIQQITSADPAQLSEQLKIRVPQAEAVNGSYGGEFKLLTNDEAKGLRQSLDSMTVPQQLDWIKSVNNSLSPKQMRAFVRQISAGDNALIAAASIASSKDGANKAQDADHIMIGRNLMAYDPEGKRQKVDGLPERSAARTIVANMLDDVVGISPEAVDGYIDSAMAHYIGKMKKQNSFADLNLKDSKNIKEFEKSVKALVPTTQIGSYNLILPYGKDEDAFIDQLDATVQSIFGGEYKKGSYSVMHAPGMGMYQLAVGGVTKGEPFELREIQPGVTQPAARQAGDSANLRVTVTQEEWDKYPEWFKGSVAGLMRKPRFEPEGSNYDYERAKAAGLGPDGTGENAGHWGSVAPVDDAERKKYRFPDEAYVILKGKSHETFDKAVSGEEERGFKVIKRGSRYYSVPKDWNGK